MRDTTRDRKNTGTQTSVTPSVTSCVTHNNVVSRCGSRGSRSSQDLAQPCGIQVSRKNPGLPYGEGGLEIADELAATVDLDQTAGTLEDGP